MTGTLEHRASRSADRLVLKGETREGRYWERSAKEKTDEGHAWVRTSTGGDVLSGVGNYRDGDWESNARMSTVRRGRQRLFQRLEDAAMFET